MSLACGLWLGGSRMVERDRLSIARAGNTKFVDVEATIKGDWTVGEGGQHRLRAGRFTVDGSPVPDADLTIYTYIDPPPADVSFATIRVRGHLRRDDNGFYSLSVKSPRLIAYAGIANAWDPREWNRRICARLDAISARYPHLSEGVVLVEALALGRSDQLSAELKASYQRAGTYHLLVFSGMQIALAAAVLSRALSFFRTPRVADWILLLLGIAAPVFAGREASVERCSWMIGLYALSRICHRPTSSANLLFVSALVRLIAHPEELGQPGFSLTYGATAGLIFIGAPLSSFVQTRIVRLVAFGVGAELSTIPLTLFFFRQAVVGSSLLTIVLAPIFAVMLLLSAAACALLFVFPPGIPPLLELIQWMETFCRQVNATVVPMNLSRSLPAPPLFILVAAYVAAVLAVVYLKKTKLVCTAFLLLTVPAASIVRAVTLSSVSEPQIEFLDVGQGDAMLVRNGSHAVLIDGGSARRPFARSGLMADLLDRGVTSLDAVALTHPHPDHCGALPEVIERLRVKELWISGRHVASRCGASLIEAAEARSVSVRIAERLPEQRLFADRHSPGVERESGDVTIEPLVPDRRFRRAAENNSSVVFRVLAEGRSILLTGDMEREAERILLARNGITLKSDVLKVAHHGSGSSTTPAILESVGPRLAVISCGRSNRFGHPQDDVVNRLLARGVRVYRTDLNGTIRLRLSKNRIFVTVEIDTPRTGA